MDIENAILEEHSKRQSELITLYIGKNQKRFDQLMALVLGDDPVAVQRSAWVMGHCFDENPQLVTLHLKDLIKRLEQKDIHISLKRNTVRILQTAKIPTDLFGTVFNLCYDFLNDPDETAAVRVYSMTVLARICQHEPELADEVSLLIRQNLPSASAGYRSRAGKTLKELEGLAQR